MAYLKEFRGAFVRLRLTNFAKAKVNCPDFLRALRPINRLLTFRVFTKLEFSRFFKGIEFSRKGYA
jgi:hypothetical protein